MQRVNLPQLAGDLLVGDHGPATHGQHAHHLFAVARDAHFLTLLDQLDQGGEPALGFVDTNGLHGNADPKKEKSGLNNEFRPDYISLTRFFQSGQIRSTTISQRDS
eukprot:Opistho-1_new@19906